MPFKKGHIKTGGKEKGTPNKRTAEIKEAVSLVIYENKDKFIEWIDRIAEKDPEKAIRILTDLMEFVIPKLARTDLTTGDKPIKPNLNITVDNSETAETLKRLRNGAKTD